MCRVVASTRLVVVCSIALAVCTNMMAASAKEEPITKKSDRTVSGVGVIDQVITSGPEPVYRADGYTFRVSATTKVRFRDGLRALNEVGTNKLAEFAGVRIISGEIVATKVEFARLKLPKRTPGPTDLQWTTFPPGSKIDAYKGIGTAAMDLPEEDEGGWCGWYPLSQDAALQERVRRVGLRVVPQYQRDLPDDDQAKIPFRFYVVEGTYRRSAIFCGNGLVLVPLVAVVRLTSDDLLAAVLAEGVAGVLQQQAEDGRPYSVKDAADLALSANGGAVAMGVLVTEQLRTGRIWENGRGRMELALMADAGFDPHQAPEAWKLLAPERLPKDPTKLKEPERSRYLLDFLKVQDTPAAAPSIAAPQANDNATTTPASPDAAPKR